MTTNQCTPPASVDTIAIWAEANNRSDSGPANIMGDTLSTGLPWPTNSADLQHFRDTTANRLLVMGHTTFKSLPDTLKTEHSLRTRPMLVLSGTQLDFATRPRFSRGHRIVFHNTANSDLLPGALLRVMALLSGHHKVAIIGGAQVIEYFEPAIDRLVVTMLTTTYHGDVRAPSNAFMKAFPVPSHFERLGNGTHVYNFTRFTYDQEA